MRSLTKSLVLLFFLVLFPFTVLAADNGKTYDFSLSLSGGSVGHGFSLAGDAVFAKKFGHLFVQGATMVNVNTKTDVKEFGFSVGTGFQTKPAGLYVFLDGLQHKQMWTQVRPVLKIGVDWLSLMGYYAIPLNKKAIQIGVNTVEAGKYYGGEINIVPLPWARIYGNLQSIENTYRAYRIGTEVRVLKFISILADWNSTHSKIFSNWHGFSGIRVALNLIFGSQRTNFRMDNSENGRLIITPNYPDLLAKTGPGNKDGDGDGDGDDDGGIKFITNVPYVYTRVDPYKSDEYYDSHVYLNVYPPNSFQGWQRIQNAQMTKNSSKEFSYVAASLPCETKLWSIVQDFGRSAAGGPQNNGEKLKILGQELDKRFIHETDPWGNSRQCACYIIKKDGSVVPW